ncbi:hypothetical protein AB0M28_06470 [Streptomyces sp. NPDC051940]|uniref:hypothetical protein n=1 Tax=Streptomyces sp. NPDC051940 TaxID=3155675 RepID=UPI003446F8F1
MAQRTDRQREFRRGYAGPVPADPEPFPAGPVPCVRARFVRQSCGGSYFAEALVDFLPGTGLSLTVEEDCGGPAAYARALFDGVAAELAGHPRLAPACEVRVAALRVHPVDSGERAFRLAGHMGVRTVLGLREPVPARKVDLRAWQGLYVTARLDDDGTLRIEGQDLTGPEYEYALTVAAADVPAVRAALGAAPASDLLHLLRRHSPEVVRRGERTWLRSLGIEPGFWSRHGD